MPLPSKITLVEVGPRDGLQNEKNIIPTDIKIELINRLSDSGLSVIEVSSFVSPKWVPQMADNKQVFAGIKHKTDIIYPVLVPNRKGYDAAKQAGATQIALFAAASEAFSQKNTNCSIEESFRRLEEVAKLAKQDKIKMRGYVSCMLGCPYEGDIDIVAACEIAKRLYDLGCEEISLSDTIGVGTAGKARKMVETAASMLPLEHLAIHFHDTYGQALANIYACLEVGISTIDSAVGGLGGCPYAQGAAGNVASEDVLYMLNGLGIETGVDINKLIDAALFICQYLGHKPTSKVSRALLAKREAKQEAGQKNS